MYTFSNKLLRKLITRNNYKSSIRLKRSCNSQIFNESRKSSSIYSYNINKKNNKNKISNENNNTRSTSIHSYRNISKSNSSFFINNNSKLNTKKILKFPTNVNKINKIIYRNNFNVSSNNQSKICKIINFKVFKKNKSIPKLKKEEESNDSICLLPNYLRVNNYKINSQKVIDYLDLNENNKTCFISADRFLKLKVANDFPKKLKPPNKLKNIFETVRMKKIKDIYPTVLNIEGHRNRKVLSELDEEEKKKIKIEKQSGIFNKKNLELIKKMIKEKWKAEKYAKANLSNMAYKRQLSLLSMKLYQKHIKFLNKKISHKFNIDFPLYNLFLNLD